MIGFTAALRRKKSQWRCFPVYPPSDASKSIEAQSVSSRKNLPRHVGYTLIMLEFDGFSGYINIY